MKTTKTIGCFAILAMIGRFCVSYTEDDGVPAVSARSAIVDPRVRAPTPIDFHSHGGPALDHRSPSDDGSGIDLGFYLIPASLLVFGLRRRQRAGDEHGRSSLASHARPTRRWIHAHDTAPAAVFEPELVPAHGAAVKRP